MRLEEITTHEVITIAPDEQASVAWSRMQRERVHRLVVVDAGRVSW